MYSVDWVESAQDELMRLWVQGDSLLQMAITQAANQIDKDLRVDPSHKGESREDADRVYFVLPLGVRLRVDEKTRTAVVLDVWLIRPCKKK